MTSKLKAEWPSKASKVICQIFTIIGVCVAVFGSYEANGVPQQIAAVVTGLAWGIFPYLIDKAEFMYDTQRNQCLILDELRLLNAQRTDNNSLDTSFEKQRIEPSL